MLLHPLLKTRPPINTFKADDEAKVVRLLRSNDEDRGDFVLQYVIGVLDYRTQPTQGQGLSL